MIRNWAVWGCLDSGYLLGFGLCHAISNVQLQHVTVRIEYNVKKDYELGLLEKYYCLMLLETALWDNGYWITL